ncbi:MAG: hypothetical protein Q8M73_11150 [Actinomycetota bacterium]|nr:hypothetical protein [Actinomycetota bacterium]
MQIHHTPEDHKNPKDKDTAQKPTNTSRAGILMLPAVWFAGSEV